MKNSVIGLTAEGCETSGLGGAKPRVQVFELLVEHFVVLYSE